MLPWTVRDSPGQSISTATRERVREAARNPGYVPNGIARALREGTSRILVLTIDAALGGNYARSYIRGLDLELAAHEHVLLVRYSHDTADRPDKQLIDAVLRRAVLRFGEPYLTGRELDDSGTGRTVRRATAVPRATPVPPSTPIRPAARSVWQPRSHEPLPSRP